MALKSSTGLKNQILTTGSLSSILTGGVIKIYGGAVPADADAAESPTLLCVISDDATGSGLNFELTAVDGVIQKSTTQIWRGVNAASGVATHYRFVATGDTGGASTTEARLQGTANMVGADLNLSNTTLVSDASQTIDYYAATLL